MCSPVGFQRRVTTTDFLKNTLDKVTYMDRRKLLGERAPPRSDVSSSGSLHHYLLGATYECQKDEETMALF